MKLITKFMKKIYLSGKHKQLFALVDDEDFEEVSKYKWSFCPEGYAFRTYTDKSIACSLRRTIYLHRQLLNAQKGQCCDHINHNKLDNRRENLRIVTRSQNGMNKLKSKNLSSIYKGVTFSKQDNKWQATICKNRKVMMIGRFDNERHAAMAWDITAKELHGEYANLNFK